LAPLTGSDALKPGEFDAEGFTIRFLEVMTREAGDGRGLLGTREREWRSARTVVSRRLASRSTSRLSQAIDVLAASPLLSVSALARALGCTVEGASGMLDELARLEIVAEVTGMTAAAAPGACTGSGTWSRSGPRRRPPAGAREADPAGGRERSLCRHSPNCRSSPRGHRPALPTRHWKQARRHRSLSILKRSTA
jgi:hypothetical protein